MRHPFFAVPAPIAIGHRGCAGEAPENTLPSFERGLADGAAILESDVHLTRDGVPVLIHDDVVDRCTDGEGPVGAFDLAALKRLDAGHRFAEAAGAPRRGRGLTIPTLREALEAFPATRFNLELKQDVAGMVEQTCTVIGQLGREADVLLTSADDALMAKLRAHVAGACLKTALGACTGEVAAFVQAAAAGGAPPPGPMALQIPPGFGGRALVTRELIEHAHRHDVQVHVWTINEPADIDALLALGVDGIVSDYPARVVAAAERAA